MEQLKHECGVAMIRLLKPLDYYQKKYGTWMYGLNKLYLMMEKQHNRGQEGAGIACVKLNTLPGNEYMFREKALGANAITEIFGSAQKEFRNSWPMQNTQRRTFLSPANCIWVTSAILRQARVACNMSIHFCAATTGRPRTCACVATSI